MKATELEHAIRQQDQIEQQKAIAKATAKARAEWYERQAQVMRKLIELLPFPGSQGNEVYQDHLRAAAALFFGLGARYQVNFDDLVKAGKQYYDVKLEQVQTANRIQKELNSASPEEKEEAAKSISEILDEDRADRL